MKKSYVMIHVIKHDMDPNSNINYRRKILPMLPPRLGLASDDSEISHAQD